jgi:autotransporter-associated beta strand protein
MKNTLKACLALSSLFLMLGSANAMDVNKDDDSSKAAAAAARPKNDDQLSGTGSLTMSGSGTLTLNGANEHRGSVTLSGGTLKARATDYVDGKLNGQTVVFAGGTLQLTDENGNVVQELR